MSNKIDIREELEARTNQDLFKIAKKLRISISRRARKAEFLEAILKEKPSAILRAANLRWWERNGGRILGTATLAGFAAGVVPLILPSSEQAEANEPTWLETLLERQAEAFRDQKKATTASVLAIEAGVVATRQGRKEPEYIYDGDALRSEVDQYEIVVRPLAEGFLYVFQVDSAGKLSGLFPRGIGKYSGGTNPVKAGEILIPEGNLLRLDGNVGEERVFVVFCATQWTELEETLKTLDQTVAPVKKREPSSRGIHGFGEKRPEKAKSAPKTKMIRNVAEALRKAGVRNRPDENIVVVERWFRHVDQ